MLYLSGSFLLLGFPVSSRRNARGAATGLLQVVVSKLSKYQRVGGSERELNKKMKNVSCEYDRFLDNVSCGTPTARQQVVSGVRTRRLVFSHDQYQYSVFYVIFWAIAEQPAV